MRNKRIGLGFGLGVASLLFLGGCSQHAETGHVDDDHGNKSMMNQMQETHGDDDDHGTQSMTSSHWDAPAVANKMVNLVAVTAESLAAGDNLFQSNCASCHGKDATGNGLAAAGMIPKPSDLVAMAGTHSDGALAWKISNGKGPMPGWSSMLTAEEIWELTNYIQSLKKTDTDHNEAAEKDEHHDD